MGPDLRVHVDLGIEVPRSGSEARAILGLMRLQRGVAVAGIEPGLARELARACLHDWTHTERIAHLAKVDVSEAQRLLHQLESEGFVAHQTRKYGGEPQVEWNTTLRGSALAGASFLRPITRVKAEGLLAGVLDRAAAYNADPDKPMWIEKISLFGSLLDETTNGFGDVDLHVVLSDRAAEHHAAEAAVAYARASGRTFANFFDELFWAKTEVIRLLKNRSGYLSIHTEDLSDVTDRMRVVYERPTVWPDVDLCICALTCRLIPGRAAVGEPWGNQIA